MMTHQKNEKSLFRVIMENSNIYLELFAQNLYFFTPCEVLESEYLNNEKR